MMLEQLLQLSLPLAPANTRLWLPRLTDPSPPSSPSTLLLPSTSPRTSGSSSRESRPRHPDSLLSRPLLVPLSLTTSTAGQSQKPRQKLTPVELRRLAQAT